MASIVFNRLIHGKSPLRLALLGMLVVAMLVAALVPLHFHLHHGVISPGDAGTVHGHSTDLHILFHAGGDSHHDESHNVEVLPDVALKKAAGNPLLIALVLVLMVLLPLASTRAPMPQLAVTRPEPRHPPHRHPPLRAPPRR